MAGLAASLMAVVAAVATLGAGWVALHIVRAGFDSAAARGNPRNRAQVHESIWDAGKGALLIAGGAGIAAFAFATLHFS